MVDADIQANDYTFETFAIQRGHCTESEVRKTLARYFNQKHLCENARIVSDRSICVDINQTRTDRRLGDCLESNSETEEPETVVDESESDAEPETVVVESEEEDDSETDFVESD